MSEILSRLRTEPAFVLGIVEALVGLLIAVGVLSSEVGGALALLFAALGTPVVRQTVTPVGKVAKVLEKSVTETNEILRKVTP